MSTMNLKDAKDHFIETGRLNRNVVRDEISISWYKCRLSQLSIDHESCTCQTNKKIKNISVFDPSFIDYLDSIIPDSFDFVLADQNHNMIYQRSDNQCVDRIQCIEEHCIGTNAGALALKTGVDQMVIKHEHYLNSWADAYSYGIPLREESDLIGVIMLIANFQPPEVEIRMLKDKLIHFESKKNKTVATDLKEFDLGDYFTYPEKFKDSFVQSLSRLSVINTPVMIMGEQGSGKTTLTWYLCLSNGLSPYFINGKTIPRIMETDIIKKSLYQNETVVIENFEVLSLENKQLLTVYTEEKIIANTSVKYRNYSAHNLILTTDYNSEDVLDKADIKLMNRYSVNTIKLKNLNEFYEDSHDIVRRLLDRYDLRISEDAIEVIVKNDDIRTFKDLSKYIEGLKTKNIEKTIVDVPDLIYKKEDVMQSLEEQEKEYIKRIFSRMDKNISATAEILKIGRSTLYRKLEKYQIDTIDKKSK